MRILNLSSIPLLGKGILILICVQVEISPIATVMAGRIDQMMEDQMAQIEPVVLSR